MCQTSRADTASMLDNRARTQNYSVKVVRKIIEQFSKGKCKFLYLGR